MLNWIGGYKERVGTLECRSEPYAAPPLHGVSIPCTAPEDDRHGSKVIIKRHCSEDFNCILIFVPFFSTPTQAGLTLLAAYILNSKTANYHLMPKYNQAFKERINCVEQLQYSNGGTKEKEDRCPPLEGFI